MNRFARPSVLALVLAATVGGSTGDVRAALLTTVKWGLRQAGAAATDSAAAAFDVREKSILELQEAMRSGKTTSKGLVEAYLARIRKYDKDGPRINAIIVLNPRAARTAEGLDEERRSRGPRG